MNNQQTGGGKNRNNGAINGNSQKRENKEAMNRAKEAMRQLRSMNQGSIPSDTMGSYTGTSYDGESPEQDADDL